MSSWNDTLLAKVCLVYEGVSLDDVDRKNRAIIQELEMSGLVTWSEPIQGHRRLRLTSLCEREMSCPSS